MDRLSELKDEQMQAAKQGWETKLKQLLDEVGLEIQLIKMLNRGEMSSLLFMFKGYFVCFRYRHLRLLQTKIEWLIQMKWTGCARRQKQKITDYDKKF